MECVSKISVSALIIVCTICLLHFWPSIAFLNAPPYDTQKCLDHGTGNEAYASLIPALTQLGHKRKQAREQKKKRGQP